MKKILPIFFVQLLTFCSFAKTINNDIKISQTLSHLILLTHSETNIKNENEVILLADSLFKNLDKVEDVKLANEIRVNLCTTLLQLDRSKVNKPLRIEKLLNETTTNNGEDFYKNTIAKNNYLLHNNYGWNPTRVFDNLETYEKVNYAVNYKFYNNQGIDNEFANNVLKTIDADKQIAKSVKENFLIKLCVLIKNDSADIKNSIKKTAYSELNNCIAEENRNCLSLFNSFSNENSDSSINEKNSLFNLPPPSGTLYAGIEVGSSAVKLSVIEFERSDDTTTFFKSVCEPRTLDIDSRKMDTNKLADIVSKVRRFYDCLLHDYSDAFIRYPENIHIAYSSGFINNFKKANYDYYLDSLDNKIKRFLQGNAPNITRLTANDESSYTFLGIIQNKKWWNKSVVMDIGNGNTKGGFFANDGTGRYIPDEFIPVTFDLASGSLKDSIDKQIGITADIQKYSSTINEFMSRVSEREIAEKIVNSNRALTSKGYVFFSGGISWVISTLKNPFNFNFKPVEITETYVANLIDSITNHYDDILSRATRDHDELIKRKRESLSNNNGANTCLSCSDYDFIFEKFDQKTTIAGAKVLLETMHTLKSFGSNKRFFVVATGKVAWTNGFIANHIE